MKKFAFILLLGSQILYAASGEKKRNGFRLNFAFGAWASQFYLEGNGHSTKVNSLISQGLELSVGFRIVPVFFEYQIVWLMPPYSARPKPQDASYSSGSAFSAGLSFPSFPVEIFGGLEKANYGLADGPNPSYGGTVFKTGLNIKVGGPADSFGFKVEYRLLPIATDNGGPLPSGFSGNVKMLYVAVLLGI